MKTRVRAVIEQDGKLFVVQHQGHQTWCLPGGGVDDGESLHAALTREMMEELGVVPDIGPLLVVHQFMRGDLYEGPEFFFRVRNAADFMNIDLTQTTHGAHEIGQFGFYVASGLVDARPSLLTSIKFDDNCPAVVLE